VAEPKTLIEAARPFSDSSLWKYQRDFYDAASLAAWSTGTVPHRLTTSPLLACDVARTLVAYFDDRRDEIDPSEPVYVVELGAGSGGFARGFLAQWFGKHRPHPQPVHYVLTDYAQSNVDGFAENSDFSKAAAAGHLSFARFDCTQPAPLQLHDGRRLLDTPPKNPLIVVANYLFDTLPTDGFVSDGKTLREWMVALYDGEDTPPGATTLLERVPHADAAFTQAPVERPRYTEPEFEAVLGDCAKYAVSFGFPIASLVALRFLADATKNRLVLLSADKGYEEMSYLSDDKPPHIAAHGSHSVTVNYYALRRQVERRGGTAWLSPGRSYPLRFFFGAFDVDAVQLPRARWAFQEAFEVFSVGDASLADLRGSSPNDVAARWAAMMRLWRYDTHRYAATINHVSGAFAGVDDAEVRDDVRETLEEIARDVHPATPYDVPLNIGLNLTQLQCFNSALKYLGQALASGKSRKWRALFAASLCLAGLGQPAQAVREAYQQALVADVIDEERADFERSHELVKAAFAARKLDVA
jgi:hypothetical protein